MTARRKHKSYCDHMTGINFRPGNGGVLVVEEPTIISSLKCTTDLSKLQDNLIEKNKEAKNSKTETHCRKRPLKWDGDELQPASSLAQA